MPPLEMTEMKEIPLRDLVAEKGLAVVADALGCSAVAIHKAVNLNRKIAITIQEDGTCTAEERRPFPSQPKRQPHIKAA